jgi:hypothetical protein
MKHLLLSTILFISLLSTQAQDRVKQKQKWARIGLITSSIVFNAIGDGLYDDGHKLAAKSFRAASIGSLLAIPVVSGPIGRKKAFKYALSYGLMRFAIFDLAYNETRGLPLNYVGTTSIHDRVVGGSPPLMIGMMRATSLWISIELNNREVSK